MNLSSNVKVILVKAAQGSAGTEVLTDIVDTAGFRGVMFFGSIATVDAGNYAKVKQDTAAAMGSAADLEGTKVVPGDDGDSFLIDVYQPKERYVRASIIRAGANTATGDVYAVLYEPLAAPTTHGATIDSELHVSPDEGTA